MSEGQSLAVGRLLEAARAEYGSKVKLLPHLERLIEPLPLAGLSVLDVGAGSGLWSAYFATQGAAVTSLEPLQEGSNPAMDSNFRRYVNCLSDPSAVTLVRTSLQNYHGDSKFDLVVLNNSINHIDESACVALLDHEDARVKYIHIFSKLASMMAPTGRIWISDCARHNLFGDLRVRNPLVPYIDWELHHQPGTWCQLMEQAGLVCDHIVWNFTSRLGSRVQRAFSRRMPCYLTTSHFTIRGRLAAV
jgi:SAM-dependent methyltransferase